jgi:hypothetical protein
MRTIFHMLLGALAGFALGIVGPVCFYLAMASVYSGMKQGGGTPFAIMIILTAPLGAMAGAAWGYCVADRRNRK